MGVRRAKAALSSGCEAHPATSLQPEATGAGMEETKCLKPSDSGPRIGDLRECAGRNVSERRAIPEKDDVQADPVPLPGKADMDGRVRAREYAPLLHRGSGGSTYTRKAHATRETPTRDQG